MVNAKKLIPVFGKEDNTLSRVGENNLENISNAVSKLIGKELKFKDKIQINLNEEETKKPKKGLTFCAGCPHRSTYYIINSAIKKLGFKSNEIIVTGDIGCTSIGVFKPLETLWTEVTMGASIALAYGFNLAGNTKPIIATLGDSTFFHSGIQPLINAVQYNCDLTVVIFDNHWTSMTGFQPNPNTGVDVFGRPTNKINIPSLIRALGIEPITINPFEFEKSIEIMADTVTKKGVKVIISKEECTLQKIRHVNITTYYFIDKEICTKCGLCLKRTSCPAIVFDNGEYYIDKSACTSCGLCAFICPFNAIKKEEK